MNWQQPMIAITAMSHLIDQTVSSYVGPCSLSTHEPRLATNGLAHPSVHSCTYQQTTSTPRNMSNIEMPFPRWVSLSSQHPILGWASHSEQEYNHQRHART